MQLNALRECACWQLWHTIWTCVANQRDTWFSLQVAMAVAGAELGACVVLGLQQRGRVVGGWLGCTHTHTHVWIGRSAIGCSHGPQLLQFWPVQVS